MKKIFALLSFAAVALSGCVNPDIDAPVAGDIEYNTTLTAAVPQTKASIADDNKKLSWNSGDKISVLTSNGVYKDFTYDGEDGATEAVFKGQLEDGETVAGYAIYPASARHSVADESPVVYLSDEYEWKDKEVKGPMVAVINEETAAFTHAGGLFAFDVKNIPAGTKAFRFSTAAKVVTGAFTYAENVISASESADGSEVTFTFDPLTSEADMKFFVPVPAGSYEDFTVSYVSGDGTVTKIRSAASTNQIAAATVKIFTVKAQSDAFYVTGSGTVEADGLSWATATTLDNALSMVEDGDVIHVAAGTYKPQNALPYTDAGEGDELKSFLINRNITLVGGYPANPSAGAVADASVNKTILDGNNMSYHTLVVSARKVSDKKVSIQGITISGGNANNGADETAVTLNDNTIKGGQGGGLVLLGTSVEMKDVTVSGNSATNTGGLHAVESDVNMSGCAVNSNTSTGNIGGANFATGTVLIADKCKFNGNTSSGYAACMYSKGAGSMNFTSCEFSSNKGNSGNGRVINLSGSCNVFFESCKFSSNTADAGNGLIHLQGRVVFDKCIISDNEAATGLIYVYSSGSLTPNVTVTNSVVKDNKATGNTGAFWLRGDGGMITFSCVNSTFSGNSASREGGMFIYNKVTANLISNTFQNNSGSSGAINIHQTTPVVNLYNNIITDKITAAETYVYKYSFVGSTCYDASGTSVETTPTFDASTMLGAINDDGVCQLLTVDGGNPALTYGMPATALQELSATTGVSADVLGKDQLGNTRTGNVAGAWAGSSTLSGL